MKSLRTTHVLIILNFLIYALMLKFGGSAELAGFSPHTLLVFGADYTPLVKLGQWYRPLASMFIHLNLLHLLMNMSALYQVGIPLERLYGRGRYAVLYLVAGLVGAGVSLLWYARSPVVSAGASGAITGLIGAAAVASHRAGPDGVRLRNLMLRWLVVIFGYGFMAKADNAAHFGGLVGGSLLALAVRPPAGRSLFTPAPKPAPESTEETPESGIRSPRAAGPEKVARENESGPGLETFALVALVAATFVVAGMRREQAYSEDELINQGVEAAQAGREDEAIALYRRALVLDAKSGTAWFDLGLSLGRKGDHDGAVDALTKAVEFGGVADAKDALIHEHLSYAHRLLKENKNDEAERAVGRATALDDRSTASLSVVALVQSAKGDHPAAIATLRQALSIAPDDELKKMLAAELVNHGVSLARAEKRAEAVPFYREATTLDPSDEVAWFDLGIALYHEKDYPGAKDALTHALALGQRRDTYVLLGDVYEELGDAAQASEMRAKAESAPEKP